MLVFGQIREGLDKEVAVQCGVDRRHAEASGGGCSYSGG